MEKERQKKKWSTMNQQGRLHVSLIYGLKRQINPLQRYKLYTNKELNISKRNTMHAIKADIQMNTFIKR